METIGERIKKRREALEISQTVLGRGCGVTRNSVSQWENGESKGLKPENLIKAADILETTPRYLVTGEPPAEIDVLRSLDSDSLDLAVRFSRLTKDQQRAVTQILSSYETTRNEARKRRRKPKETDSDGKRQARQGS